MVWSGYHLGCFCLLPEVSRSGPFRQPFDRPSVFLIRQFRSIHGPILFHYEFRSDTGSTQQFPSALLRIALGEVAVRDEEGVGSGVLPFVEPAPPLLCENNPTRETLRVSRGPPVVPTFTNFFWGGSPTKRDQTEKKWVPTYSNLSNLEDLVGFSHVLAPFSAV